MTMIKWWWSTSSTRWSSQLLTILLSGRICLISPLKNETIMDCPSAETCFRVPLEKRISRIPFVNVRSTWEHQHIHFRSIGQFSCMLKSTITKHMNFLRYDNGNDSESRRQIWSQTVCNKPLSFRKVWGCSICCLAAYNDFDAIKSL